MIRPVHRSELVDLQSYERVRPTFREEVLRAKGRRRVHVGEHFTFLFENALTVRYQIQEMLRAERITEEAAVLHEVQTYNGLLWR